MKDRIGTGVAARKLGCTPKTVRQHILRGDLDGKLIKGANQERGRWAVTTASVERLVERIDPERNG